MGLKNLFLCLLFLGAVKSVQGADEQDADTASAKKLNQPHSIIYLNDGTKIKCDIVSRSPTALEIQEPQSEDTRRIQLSRVLLIDEGSAGIMIPEKKIAEKQEPIRSERMHFEIGVVTKAAYLYGGDLGQYAEDLGKYLANQQLGSNGAAFSAQQQSTLGLTLGVGGEFRITRGKFRLDLAGGYYNSRNVVTRLENRPDPERMISIAPMSVSGTSTLSYFFLELWGGQVWTGIGAGFFWQSLELDFTTPSGSTKSTFTGWALGAVGKIEYDYPLFGLNFVLGIEATLAPITRYESQGIALINGSNGKVVASGHSGAALYFGVLYQL